MSLNRDFPQLLCFRLKILQKEFPQSRNGTRLTENSVVPTHSFTNSHSLYSVSNACSLLDTLLGTCNILVSKINTSRLSLHSDFYSRLWKLQNHPRFAKRNGICQFETLQWRWSNDMFAFTYAVKCPLGSSSLSKYRDIEKLETKMFPSTNSNWLDVEG